MERKQTMQDQPITDEVLKALERIAKSMEESAAAMRLGKAPEIWYVEEIAAWIRQSYGHTRDRVVKMPGFPKPIPTGGWFSDEVIEWFRINRGKIRKAA